jgi:hypothetical protein
VTSAVVPARWTPARISSVVVSGFMGGIFPDTTSASQPAIGSAARSGRG